MMGNGTGDAKGVAADPPAERRPSGSSKKLKGSLTALGTAAVLGIYSAGYALTEDAARRLEEQFGTGAEPPLSPDVPAQVVTQVPVTDVLDTVGSGPEVAAAPEETAPVPAAATASVTAAATDKPAPAPKPAATSAPASGAAVAANRADTTATELATTSPYRDGTYSSWGERTRHGEIEARVEISGGKITSATVVSCGMRWPCSDINRLIPRVAERQSTDVGIVTGATQSSDAFVTAVRAALIMAMDQTP